MFPELYGLNSKIKSELRPAMTSRDLADVYAQTIVYGEIKKFTILPFAMENPRDCNANMMDFAGLAIMMGVGYNIDICGLIGRTGCRLERMESSMAQVNIAEAKTDLPKLVRLLETHQEDVILIARDGTPVVEMKLAKRKPATKRIGVAKGKLHVPDDFDKWDGEIVDMFGDAL